MEMMTKYFEGFCIGMRLVVMALIEHGVRLVIDIDFVQNKALTENGNWSIIYRFSVDTWRNNSKWRLIINQ